LVVRGNQRGEALAFCALAMSPVIGSLQSFN
jgi:hypothetical protein